MKKARLIYNPTSGRELLRKKLPYILERLEKAGYETSTHATTGKGCATNAAKLAVENGFDLIVAAGGDGTIFEVINGIAPYEKRPTLGIIPAGTTNDLARALKIPKRIKKACNVLSKGNIRPIDIGKANDKYFLNVAAGGMFTEITYEVPSKLKTLLGYLAYYLKGIEKIPFIAPNKVKIDYDEHLYLGDILLFLICNTQSVAGFDHLAYNSTPDDGLLDLIIVEKMNFPKLLNLGFLTLSGRALKDSKIKYIQAKKIKIEAQKSMKLNLDGEYGGVLPIEFTILKHHINIIVPD